MKIVKYNNRAKALFACKTEPTETLHIAVNPRTFAVYDANTRQLIEKGKHSLQKLSYMLADFPLVNDNHQPLVGKGAGTFKF